MKKYFILFLLLVSSISIHAQESNNIVYDEIAEEDILLGYCNRNGLLGDNFNFWFHSEYESYSVDMESLNQINADIFSSLKIKVVMGTWCSDSKREVPRFNKILDQLAFNFNDLIIIGVNRIKQAEETEVDQLNIELVPTFIFYYEGEEIGRIIESPVESLEKDIINIISTI